MSKYKVALFYDIYGKPDTGGTTIRPYNLVQMLLKYDIDFKVFCTNTPNPTYDIPGKVLQLSEFNPKDFNIFWAENSLKAIEQLNAQDISPIIGTNVIPNSAPQHSLPYVNRSGLARQESSIHHEKQIIQKYKAKFWLSQSDFQEKEYRRLGLPYNIDVLRAPNPVDTTIFYPSQQNLEPFIIGYTGKNNWAKQPIFLHQIALAFPSIKFYCFSDNTIPIKFTNNVKVFIGLSNGEVANKLRECSMFISTSVTENEPLGVLEAMATELPIIGFRTSGLPEIVREHYNGRLVDLGNIEHFKVEIQRLSKDKPEMFKLGKNGRQFIHDNFSYKACYVQYCKIFQKYLEDIK